MKQSIKKIFTHINLIFLFTALFACVALLLMVEQNNSYKKTNNLNTQKKTLEALIHLDTSDKELALINFNSKSALLHTEIKKLYNLYKLDIVGQYILNNKHEYYNDLEKLSALITEFNAKAREFYKYSHQDQIKEQLLEAFNNTTTHINNMILKNITYDKTKFDIYKKAALVVFVMFFIIALWYRKKLKLVYEDILSLYSPQKVHHKIYTEEIDAIAMRIHRKPLNASNPDMIDPVTGIKNYKGLLSSFAEKKDMKESNFLSISVLEIDNFSKTNMVLPQEVIHSILKKITFTISLHEQATDIIARTDYNQFIVILSRPSKAEAYKEIEVIRASIEETKFKIPKQGYINITLSGGFIIKPKNQSLEDAIKNAKDILKYAINSGGNRISQLRDLAESNL